MLRTLGRLAVLAVWALFAGATWLPIMRASVPQIPVTEVPESRDRSTGRVVALRETERRLLFIDDTIVSSVDLADTPRAGVTAPGGDRMYLATDRDVAVVDLAQGTIIEHLPTGRVDHLTLDADGRVLYAVATSDSQTEVTALDIQSRQVRGAVTLARGLASSIVASPDGLLVYVGHRYYSGIISVVDVRGGSSWELPAIEDGVAALAMSPDGQRLYAANGSTSGGRVDVFDTGLGRAVASLETGAEPSGLVLAADNRIFTADFRDERVTVSDASGRTPAQTIPVAPWPADLAFDSIRNTLYLAHNQTSIVAIDAASGASIVLDVAPGDTEFVVRALPADGAAIGARVAAYGQLTAWLSRLRLVAVAGLVLALLAGVVAGRIGSGTVLVAAVAVVAGLIAGGLCWWLGTQAPPVDWLYAPHRPLAQPPAIFLTVLTGALTTFVGGGWWAVGSKR